MSVDLDRFETALIDLEHLVKEAGSTSDEVFRRSLDALNAALQTDSIQVWLRTNERTDLQFFTDQLSPAEQKAVIAQIQGHAPGKFLQQKEGLYASVSVCLDTDLVVLCHRIKKDISADARSALDAILECLGDFYRRVLLNSVEARIASVDGYAQLFAVVANTVDQSDRQFQIASGVRAMLNADRVTLLHKEGEAFVFDCCSNNRMTDSKSSLQRFLVGVAEELSLKQNTVVKLDAESEISDSLQQLRNSGVACVSLVSSGDDEHPCSFLIESFNTPLEAPPLSLLKSQIPRLSVLASRHSKHRGPTGKRLRNWGVVASLLMLLGVFCPVPFNIEVRGQAFPVQRVHVFAPSDGVIESLEIDNESKVQANEILAVIRNETLNKELQYTQGQLSTEEAKLISMQRSRSNETRTGESARFSEAATQQRIADLKTQLGILQLENARMKIASPCQGVIVRADLKEELLLRPVRRGQSLFEIVSNTGDWQLELDVPDEVMGYIRVAVAESDSPLNVQYVLREHLSDTLNSSLKKLDETVTLKGNEYYCRATAGVDSTLYSKLRPGASVTARINCGRRPIAFVAFREVIEFVKEKSFSWW